MNEYTTPLCLPTRFRRFFAKPTATARADSILLSTHRKFYKNGLNTSWSGFGSAGEGGEGYRRGEDGGPRGKAVEKQTSVSLDLSS